MSIALESHELAATGARTYIKKIEGKGGPTVQYTVNSQGTILNAVFSTDDQAVAKRIADFVAAHNLTARVNAAVSK